MITQERLKEVLHYNPKTGIFTWRESIGNTKKGSIAGAKFDGYIRVSVDGKNYLAHRLAWLYSYGYFRVRADNKISNIREVSNQCNIRNAKIYASNKSGVTGVCWYKPGGKWAASMSLNGKHIHLCYHTELLEAACHRLAAEQAENWEGCDSSSSAYKYVKKTILRLTK